MPSGEKDPSSVSASGVNEGLAAGRASPESEQLRLVGEELSVAVKQVETGRVRVRAVTREHEEAVNVGLGREMVEVERIPFNRQVESIPPTRQDGDTTILSVVEERLILKKVLVLTEEVRVRRIRSIEQYEENVILRRQEATITRLPADATEVGSQES